MKSRLLSRLMSHPLVQSPWFWVGLTLKFILLFSPGSHYLMDLFIPFIDQSVLHPGTNPWSMSSPESFPYGSVLFFCLWLPKVIAFSLFGTSALGASLFSCFLMKLPLLGFDLFLYWILHRLSRSFSSGLVFFYWLNPVLIYITYIHGQLDVASMALTLASIAFLGERKWKTSALFFAGALLCKFHVILLVPFYWSFLWNTHFTRDAVKVIGRWSLLCFSIAALGFWPLFEAGRLLYASTTSPEAYRLFAARLSFGDQTEFYLGLSLVLLVLVRLCLSTRISPTGLVYGSGLVMGSLLLATHPMPGWFYWVFPFLALFFAQYRSVPRSLFLALIAFYFIYFGAQALDLSSFAKSLSITLLQSSLAASLIALYVVVLRFESQLRNRVRPFFIGLGGDSGAGKNYFSELIKDLFTSTDTLVIEGDDYHRWERGDQQWQNWTHLHPQANHLGRMQEHAHLIHRGLPIRQAHYDHSSGKFTSPQLKRPTKTVIFQGLHSLYFRRFRNFLDLGIFLAPSDPVRLQWKLNRDVKERGHATEKVLQSIESRRPDSAAHIDPQKAKSDWIIEYDLSTTASSETAYCVRHTLSNDEPLLGLMEQLKTRAQCQVDVHFSDSDLDRMFISIQGNPSQKMIEELAQENFPNFRQITRARHPARFRSGYDGIHQLILLALVQNRNQFLEAEK